MFDYIDIHETINAYIADNVEAYLWSNPGASRYDIIGAYNESEIERTILEANDDDY